MKLGLVMLLKTWLSNSEILANYTRILSLLTVRLFKLSSLFLKLYLLHSFHLKPQSVCLCHDLTCWNLTTFTRINIDFSPEYSFLAPFIPCTLTFYSMHSVCTENIKLYLIQAWGCKLRCKNTVYCFVHIWLCHWNFISLLFLAAGWNIWE